MWKIMPGHRCHLHRGKTGETYNIGGNNEWKNIDLIRLLCRIMDKKLEGRRGIRKADFLCKGQGRA